MSQKRMLSRRISQSKKFNRTSLKTQVLYICQIPFLDDYGCYTADAEDIKTEVFPKNNKISMADIGNSVIEMADIGLIHFYTVDNKPYQQYTKFNDFQTFRADRPKNGEYPQFDPNSASMEDNGIPMTDNDGISKVNLSKSNLSKVKEEPTYTSIKEIKESPNNPFDDYDLEILDVLIKLGYRLKRGAEKDMSEWMDELTKEFDDININIEIKGFRDWWSDKKIKNHKSSLRNWLIKARKFKKL